MGLSVRYARFRRGGTLCGELWRLDLCLHGDGGLDAGRHGGGLSDRRAGGNGRLRADPRQGSGRTPRGMAGPRHSRPFCRSGPTEWSGRSRPDPALYRPLQVRRGDCRDDVEPALCPAGLHQGRDCDRRQGLWSRCHPSRSGPRGDPGASPWGSPRAARFRRSANGLELDVRGAGPRRPRPARSRPDHRYRKPDQRNGFVRVCCVPVWTLQRRFYGDAVRAVVIARDDQHQRAGGFRRLSRRSARLDAVLCSRNRSLLAGPRTARLDHAVATVRSAIGKQPIAVPSEPFARHRAAGREAFHQTPKTRPVVHLREMRNLVCNDIVDDRLRRKDQSPTEGKVGSPRTAPHRLFVSRTLTRATLFPIRKASRRARWANSLRAIATRWSRRRRARCSGSPRTRISPSTIATGGAPASNSRRMRRGIPSTGTIAPSANGSGGCRVRKRAVTHSRFATRKRKPWLAVTPRGRTSSTRCSAASIRNPIRRARRLTRIDNGAPRSSAATCRRISSKAKFHPPCNALETRALRRYRKAHGEVTDNASASSSIRGRLGGLTSNRSPRAEDWRQLC